MKNWSLTCTVNWYQWERTQESGGIGGSWENKMVILACVLEIIKRSLGCILFLLLWNTKIIRSDQISRSVVSDSLSTPGLPVHHKLPEFTQTHVHRVSDAIQPSHPLSSPSSAPNPSQHQSLFQWVNSSHEVAKWTIYLQTSFRNKILLYTDSLVAQLVKNLPAVQETWVWFLGREDSLEKDMPTTPVFLPGEWHRQRSLAGHSPWHRKKSDTLKQPSMHAHRVLPMQSVGKHADFSSCNLWAL